MGMAKHSILVTSRAEDDSVLDLAAQKGVRVLSKLAINQISIR